MADSYNIYIPDLLDVMLCYRTWRRGGRRQELPFHEFAALFFFQDKDTIQSSEPTSSSKSVSRVCRSFVEASFHQFVHDFFARFCITGPPVF